MDSSSEKDSLLEVLEEVVGEVAGLAEELRRWKGVEERVEVLERMILGMREEERSREVSGLVSF